METCPGCGEELQYTWDECECMRRRYAPRAGLPDDSIVVGPLRARGRRRGTPARGRPAPIIHRGLGGGTRVGRRR
ncbi:MAG: hypothetical protein V1849_01045, partial [Chloroflexota bacterium]